MPGPGEQTRLVATSTPGRPRADAVTGQELGPRVKTVLGLSVTAAGVGWVLVDGGAPGGCPLDDDHFVLRDLDDLVPRCLAAVRGAQAIAASSGRQISSIGLCWSTEVADRVDALLGALRSAGCTDVRPVRLVTPVTVRDSEAPAGERSARVDPCGLLAELFSRDSEPDDDALELVHPERDAASGPGAGRTSAYDAAQAVVTNTAPPEPIEKPRSRRNWPPAWQRPTWSALPGERMATVAAAAAVTAVIALFAVGSQSFGPGAQQAPGEAALAGRTSTAPSSTEVPHAEPPAARPMAPLPAAAPAPAEVSVPPVRLALPQQPRAVTQPSAVAEPPVSAVPLVASPATPDPPAAVPEPAPPLTVPEPALPVATPPADPAAALPPVPHAPPPLLPPAPFAPPPFAPPAAPPPAPLAPPAPLPPPAVVPPAPADPLPPGPPVPGPPPLNPFLSALP